MKTASQSSFYFEILLLLLLFFPFLSLNSQTYLSSLQQYYLVNWSTIRETGSKMFRGKHEETLWKTKGDKLGKMEAKRRLKRKGKELVRKMYDEGHSYREIAKKLRISFRDISRILKEGRGEKHQQPYLNPS